MKSKKLLILIASIAAVVVVICILAAVFSIKKADNIQLVYHDFSGERIATPKGGIAADDVFTFAKGKSAIFLSKNKLLNQMNTTYTHWHAFAIVKNFPNNLEIHLVERTAILKIDVSGKEVYIDSFGYVVNPPDGGRYIDATSAFKSTTEAKSQQVGARFEFAVEENNVRLNYILEALLATWQCNVDIEDFPAILSENNVFAFDDDGAMLIRPSSGGTIKILSPATDLTNHLIKAYGVYYNEFANVQDESWVITVKADGTVTTPNPNKK